MMMQRGGEVTTFHWTGDCASRVLRDPEEGKIGNSLI